MIYLAAPYSHEDPQVIEDRMEIFRRVNNRLNENGHFCVSPLMNHFTGMRGTWETWKAYSLTLLPLCSKMVVLTIEGWEDSSGLSGEIQFCEEQGIPVEFVTPDSVLSQAIYAAPPR